MGLRFVLEREPDIEVVGEADQGYAAVEAAHSLRPTIVVVDIDAPRLGGIEVTRELADANSASPSRVVVLATRYDEERVAEALHAGALAFLLKDDPLDQFVYAVRMVAAGAAVLTGPATGRMLRKLATSPSIIPRGSPDLVSVLTQRELEVLRLVALGHSTPHIAALLSVSEATVRSHVHHLLQKLDLDNRSQAVALAFKSGLGQPGDGDRR